jgi:hypothetical protein
MVLGFADAASDRRRILVGGELPAPSKQLYSGFSKEIVVQAIRRIVAPNICQR